MQFVVLLLFTLVLVTTVTFIDLGERRIPVQYAKRSRPQMYGGQSTHIPLKVLSVGVLPLIFAIPLWLSGYYNSNNWHQFGGI